MPRAGPCYTRPQSGERGSIPHDLQLIEPAAFRGRDAFVDRMGFLAERCRANPPIHPDRPVRPPGERAGRGIARARAEGVPVSSRTAAAPRAHAARLGLDAGVLGRAGGRVRVVRAARGAGAPVRASAEGAVWAWRANRSKMRA